MTSHPVPVWDQILNLNAFLWLPFGGAFTFTNAERGKGVGLGNQIFQKTSVKSNHFILRYWTGVVERPYLISLAVIGSLRLLGTLLSVLVLYKSQLLKKKVFYQLLFALACFDLIFIASYIVSIGYELFSVQAPYLVKFVTSILNYYGFTGSIYMTVAISVERYFGICRPLKTSRKKARVYFASVLLWTTLVGLPLFSEDSIILTGKGLVFDKVHAWAETEGYAQYDLWVHIVLNQFVLPMSLLFFFNLAVIRHVYVSSKALGNFLFPRRRETKTTKILIAIVILSMCHHTPRIVHHLLQYYMPFLHHEIIVPVYEIALMIIYSVSFLIYAVIGDTLRKEVVKLLKCQRRRRSIEVETVSVENHVTFTSFRRRRISS